MFRGKKLVAIVPARSGSKGIPGKNLLKIEGETLTNRTLLRARKCSYIDDVVLTSDSKYLIEEALKLGFSVRRRPDELARDSSLANDVVRDCIQFWRELNGEQDFFVLYLQPTSPFRSTTHIESALALLKSSPKSALVSVKRAKESAYSQFAIEDGVIVPVLGENFSNGNRQEQNETFIPNGAIYLFSTIEFEEAGGRIPYSGALPFLMSEEESLDLDTPADVEKLMANLRH